MWLFLLFAAFSASRTGPVLWPFIGLFWGLVYVYLHFWKGWL